MFENQNIRSVNQTSNFNFIENLHLLWNKLYLKGDKKTFFSSFKFSKGIFLNLQKKLDSATRDKQERLSYIFQKETFVKGESSSNTFVSLVNSERLEETSLLELEQAAAASCERQIIDIFFSTL